MSIAPIIYMPSMSLCGSRLKVIRLRFIPRVRRLSFHARSTAAALRSSWACLRLCAAVCAAVFGSRRWVGVGLVVLIALGFWGLFALGFVSLLGWCYLFAGVCVSSYASNQASPRSRHAWRVSSCCLLFVVIFLGCPSGSWGLVYLFISTAKIHKSLDIRKFFNLICLNIGLMYVNTYSGFRWNRETKKPPCGGSFVYCSSLNGMLFSSGG